MGGGNCTSSAYYPILVDTRWQLKCNFRLFHLLSALKGFCTAIQEVYLGASFKSNRIIFLYNFCRKSHLKVSPVSLFSKNNKALAYWLK